MLPRKKKKKKKKKKKISRVCAICKQLVIRVQYTKVGFSLVWSGLVWSYRTRPDADGETNFDPPMNFFFVGQNARRIPRKQSKTSWPYSSGRGGGHRIRPVCLRENATVQWRGTKGYCRPPRQGMQRHFDQVPILYEASLVRLSQDCLFTLCCKCFQSQSCPRRFLLGVTGNILGSSVHIAEMITRSE